MAIQYSLNLMSLRGSKNKRNEKKKSQEHSCLLLRVIYYFIIRDAPIPLPTNTNFPSWQPVLLFSSSCFSPYSPWNSFSLYRHISLPPAPLLIATHISWLVTEDLSGSALCLQIRSHQKTALPRWAPWLSWSPQLGFFLPRGWWKLSQLLCLQLYHCKTSRSFLWTSCSSS